MRNSERQNAIMDILKAQKFADVKELSHRLYTSPSSIRRDLDALQARGLCMRNHGGVVLKEGYLGVPAFEVRVKKNIVGKKKTASKAAGLLRDNISIMLDGSSTAAYMIPYIKNHKNVTVFSNNMKTVGALSQEGVRALCIGGEAYMHSSVLLGAYTVENARQLFPDILFFSSQYIDDEGNITDYSVEDVALRKVMLKNAKYKVFLCDGDKIGKRSAYKLCDLNDIDCAVFDTSEAQRLYSKTAKAEIL